MMGDETSGTWSGLSHLLPWDPRGGCVHQKGQRGRGESGRGQDGWRWNGIHPSSWLPPQESVCCTFQCKPSATLPVPLSNYCMLLGSFWKIHLLYVCTSSSRHRNPRRTPNRCLINDNLMKALALNKNTGGCLTLEPTHISQTNVQNVLFSKTFRDPVG